MSIRHRTFLLAVCAAAVPAALGCAGRAHRLDQASEQVIAAYPKRENSAARPEEANDLQNADAPPSRFDRLKARRHAGGNPAATEPPPQTEAGRGEATPERGAASRPAVPEGFLLPLGQGAAPIPVTLEACIRRSLANNLQIQIARFGPALAETAVVEAEAMFDPAWFLNSALNRLRHSTGSFLSGATTLGAKQWDLSTGVDTLLPTGAAVSLSQDWTRLESNSAFLVPNPQYEGGLVLSVRQPLLRGAGLEVGKSPIVLARLDHTVSLADFLVELMDALLQVERTYWELLVAETRVQALAEALQAARENRRIARLRFERGKTRRVIVSLADSAVTSREADLIAARLRLEHASDRLKRLMNDPDLPLDEPVLLDAVERPLAEPIPVNLALFQHSILTAMKFRPELSQAEARLEQAGLRERVARHERLPQLDLAASYGLNGLRGDLGPALGQQMTTEFFDWFVGVELRVPIGNRARTAAYGRARLERARSVKQFEDRRQRVLLEVNEAVRNLAAAEKAVLATRAAREAAEQTLHDQQANVGAGAALMKDLLEAQRDLADAKVREMRAMADYIISLAALERAKGTLLEYNNIRLVEEAD